jgi:hypothetical protein
MDHDRPTFDRRGLNLKEKSVCVCSTARATPVCAAVAAPEASGARDSASSWLSPSRRLTVEWLIHYNAGIDAATNLYSTSLRHHRSHSGNRRPPSEDLSRDPLNEPRVDTGRRFEKTTFTGGVPPLTRINVGVQYCTRDSGSPVNSACSPSWRVPQPTDWLPR